MCAILPSGSGMPEPLGKIAHIKCFVDAEHTGNVVTLSFHTVVFMYAINASIIWFSKEQNNVYSSTVGYEFMVIHIARGLIVELH